MHKLSIINEFIPKTQHSLVFTKPAIATLGDKKECEPIIESCDMLQEIFKIVLLFIFTLGSNIQPG
jgi:hypothetical protein